MLVYRRATINNAWGYTLFCWPPDFYYHSIARFIDVHHQTCGQTDLDPYSWPIATTLSTVQSTDPSFPRLTLETFMTIHTWYPDHEFYHPFLLVHPASSHFHGDFIPIFAPECRGDMPPVHGTQPWGSTTAAAPCCTELAMATQRGFAICQAQRLRKMWWTL